MEHIRRESQDIIQQLTMNALAGLSIALIDVKPIIVSLEPEAIEELIITCEHYNMSRQEMEDSK